MSAAKFWVGAAMALLSAVLPAMTDNMGATGWFNVFVLAAGAFAVLSTPNTEGWGKAKAVVAALSAAVVVLISVWEGGVDAGEAMQVVAALLAALGVYAVPNKDAELA